MLHHAAQRFTLLICGFCCDEEETLFLDLPCLLVTMLQYPICCPRLLQHPLLAVIALVSPSLAKQKSLIEKERTEQHTLLPKYERSFQLRKIRPNVKLNINCL